MELKGGKMFHKVLKGKCWCFGLSQAETEKGEAVLVGDQIPKKLSA
jgi:hypothetical protein